jgi:YbbR domain-containing protein
VRRALDFLLRNWPLKLGAVVLSTVLYSGLVLGQNVRTWTGQLPVDAIRPPAGATLLNDLEPVTVIRYRAPIDVGVLSPSAFSATVDLSQVQAESGGPPVSVPITVIALDQRIQIVDFTPREEQVQLDPVTSRDMPVTVMLGTVPDTIKVGPPQVDPQTVTLRGASSRVNSVAAVVARVPIDASALNVDRDVDLVAVDANGNEVPSLEIDPQRAHVTIAVSQQLSTRTLPVVPQLTGAPAPGYKVTSVTVNPVVATVTGDAAAMSSLESAQTQPIDLTGRTSDLDAQVSLSLPSGVTVSGSGTVMVSITIAQDTGTQTYSTGVILQNEQAGFTYTLGVSQVNVTLGGPTSLLQSFDPTQLTATADAANLVPGDHILHLAVQPPDGMSVVAIDPQEITVTVTAPPTPSPPPTSPPVPTP